MTKTVSEGIGPQLLDGPAVKKCETIQESNHAPTLVSTPPSWLERLESTCEVAVDGYKEFCERIEVKG